MNCGEAGSAPEALCDGGFRSQGWVLVLYRRMNDLNSMQQEVVAFRKARYWEQFHKPKDCAISLALEAAEVMER